MNHKTNSRRHPKWKEIQFWFKKWTLAQIQGLKGQGCSVYWLLGLGFKVQGYRRADAGICRAYYCPMNSGGASGKSKENELENQLETGTM